VADLVVVVVVVVVQLQVTARATSVSSVYSQSTYSCTKGEAQTHSATTVLAFELKLPRVRQFLYDIVCSSAGFQACKTATWVDIVPLDNMHA
jgi:hypothetical protein